MFSHALSGATVGINAHLIQVETHIEHAIPGSFNVVGLPDAAVRESGKLGIPESRPSQKRLVCKIGSRAFSSSPSC
jgi:hypothetical protein